MQAFRNPVLLVSMTLWLIGCEGIHAIPDKTATQSMGEGRAAEKSVPASPMQGPAPKPASAPEYITKPKAAAAPATSVRGKTSHAYAKKIIHSSGKVTAPHLPSPPPDEGIHSYLVKVETNKKMEVSIDPEKPASGLLRVWIGQPLYEPKTQAGMTAASSVLQTSAPAASAKVTPIVLNDPAAFKIKPMTETRCQVITPTGTEVPFSITPIKTGEFSVGASVELYENRGCEGDASTQTAEPTTVEVTVQLPPRITFLEIAWAAIKNFIKEILALLFAMVILVFRKRLSKLFGIEGDKQ